MLVIRLGANEILKELAKLPEYTLWRTGSATRPTGKLILIFSSEPQKNG
jgi:hypothetical protein